MKQSMMGTIVDSLKCIFEPDSRKFQSVFFAESLKGEKNALIPSGLAGGLCFTFFCVFCVAAVDLRFSPLIPRRS